MTVGMGCLGGCRLCMQ